MQKVARHLLKLDLLFIVRGLTLCFNKPVVSDGGYVKGQELIQILVELSGLPENLAKNEVEKLAAERNKSIDSLTLDDLRVILSNYLQDVLLAAKQGMSQFEDDDCELAVQD